MRIVYVAGCVSEAVYGKLFSKPESRPAFQAQKYHRLFAEGLAAHTRVDVVGYPSVDGAAMEESCLDLPEETVGGVHYHYIRAYRNHLRRWLHLCAGSFFRCMKLLDRDSVVMIDCLNQMTGLGALLASWVKGCRCVGIVTDLPEFLGGGPTVALAEFLIRRCTDYVVLTQAMNERINKKGKPYVVLEGHADITMASREPSLAKKSKKRKQPPPGSGGGAVSHGISEVWLRRQTYKRSAAFKILRRYLYNGRRETRQTVRKRRPWGRARGK